MYEPGYRPARLANWEVGRSFPERPRHRRGPTRVIADDRGHLLPGVARSHATPWGPLAHTPQDCGVGERQHPASSETHSPVPQHVLEVGEQDEDDGSELQVTGAGLQSGGCLEQTQGQYRRGGQERGHGEVIRASIAASSISSFHSPSSSSSGSITPATFRKHEAIKGTTTTASSASVGSRSRKSAGANNNGEGANETVKVKGSEHNRNPPPDTVEDALLPRRPEEELVKLTGSRALAIRLVDHPAPTNCTKYVVLRPNTAPTPPATKPPLLPKRPKTSKVIRKVPEIEFALKWDLKENDIMEEVEEEEKEEVVKKPVRRRSSDLPSPRSVSSVDSGVHIPKTAWAEGPDTKELSSRLERLEGRGKDLERLVTRTPETESGYGTPKSRDSRSSLPSVASRATSGRGSVQLPLKTGSIISRNSNDKHSGKISMDSQRLAQRSPAVSPKTGGSSLAQSGVVSRRQSARSSKGSEKNARISNSRQEAHGAPSSQRAEDKRVPSPQPQPQRDPLAIMETMDSVFHTVPLRDTGRASHTRTHRSLPTERRQVAAETQTEALAGQHMVDVSTAAAAAAAAVDNRGGHNHPGQLRSRNCMACEVKALEEPPKKFHGPSDYKPAFRAGKVHQTKSIPKPKYLRQSGRYQARLKARHHPPRYWPINTLSSPFCNKSGYGQDQYPDHMRLRSTYGMAHPSQQPAPAHGTLLKKLYL
ncbi:hypothetical protein Pmani_002967 [Petrolisthes manimaculis]|uniref:Cilia- and flagella-associated protein 126 n=1 Tax=Petrolisthes manimaculis TaxID=1843537 RepID=A0AAE1QHA3_9EUCA|nr:hypothetical protein Pmani_002967 [Petrolisthes manimaculis]